jgi:hypothetical protein
VEASDVAGSPWHPRQMILSGNGVGAVKMSRIGKPVAFGVRQHDIVHDPT